MVVVVGVVHCRIQKNWIGTTGIEGEGESIGGEDRAKRRGSPFVFRFLFWGRAPTCDARAIVIKAQIFPKAQFDISDRERDKDF